MNNGKNSLPVLQPTPDEEQLAREGCRKLGQLSGGKEHAEFDVRIHRQVFPEESVRIPPGVFRLLKEILEQLSQGNAVILTNVTNQLTLEQAAAILNVSTHFLREKLDNGDIPTQRAGAEYTILLSDIQLYKQQNKRNRLAALEELSRLDQELGLGY